MAKTRGAGRKMPHSPLDSDMEDDVDKFHKKRDKLSLTLEDDAPPASDDDSLDDEAVYDVSDSESDDSLDEDSEDDEHRRKCKAYFI